MAKRKVAAEVPENSVIVYNAGPVRHAEFKFAPGCVTLLSGNNGSGKSESLTALRALGGNEEALKSLTLRDGAEEGWIRGFGREIKLTAHTRKLTGEIDILSSEDQFSLADIIKPRFKTPEACDKVRISNLAAITGVRVESDSVAALLGGYEPSEERSTAEEAKELERCQTIGKKLYKRIVTEKTTKAKESDAAEFVGNLKRDMDAGALELEKEAAVVESSAATLEETLPPNDPKAETDAEVLSQRLKDAVNAKRSLDDRATAAAEMKRLADAAKAVLEAGQGQTVDDAATQWEKSKEDTRFSRDELQRARDTVIRLEGVLNTQLEIETRLQNAHAAAVIRKDKLYAATTRLNQQAAPPTDEEFTRSEAAIKAAEDASFLGQSLRKAVMTRQEIAAKRQEAKELSDEAAALRSAAKATLNLLAGPINDLECGVRVTENMRLECDHPARGHTMFDDLSEGERVAIVIRLVSRICGAEEMPSLVILDQQFYESLDATNRKMLETEVAKTKLMVAIAEATRVGSQPVVGSRILGE